MQGIRVKLGRVGRHYSIELNVDGVVGSSQIFGCSDGLLPMIAGFLATEAQIHAVRAGTERYVTRVPTFVAVTMPSGSVLTFVLTTDEKLLAEIPENPSQVRSATGGRDPIAADAGHS